MKRHTPISKPIPIIALTIIVCAAICILLALAQFSIRKQHVQLLAQTQLLHEYDNKLAKSLEHMRDGTLFSDDPGLRSLSKDELTNHDGLRANLLARMTPQLSDELKELEDQLATILGRMTQESPARDPKFPEQEFQALRSECFADVQRFLAKEQNSLAASQQTLLLAMLGFAGLLSSIGIALILFFRHAYQKPARTMVQALEERAQIPTDCRDPGLTSLAYSLNQLIGRFQDTRQARFILDSMTEGLLIISPQGRILSANKSILEMLGYEESDLVGRPFTEIYVKVKSVHVQGFFKRTETYKEEELFKTAGGKIIPVRFSSSFLFDQDMEVLGFVCIAKDITKEKKVEEELQKQSDWFKITLASIADAVITTDTEGRVNFCNQAARHLLSLEDDPEQKPLDSLFRPLDPVTRQPHLIETTIAKGEPIKKEWLLRQSDGKELTIDLIQAPIRSNEGLFHGTVFVLHDITQVRLTAIDLQEAKEKAETALELKSRFLAVMSHELRTPMGGVLGMVEQLLQTEMTPEQRQITDIIHKSGESLLHLLNDILDFSKFEAGKLELDLIPFNVSTLVAEVVELLSQKANAKGVMLHATIDPAIPLWLCGDPTRIRQILLNLTSNAIKFTAQGEVALKIELERREDERVEVLWQVRDTGIGIAPEAMPRLFEAFTQATADTTRKYGGTGLGLTICKELTEAMHGTIWATSQPGVGSVFSFSLPLNEARGGETLASAPSSSTPSLPDETQLYRILVAEDNPVNQRVAEHVLAQLGFSSRIVGDGRAALEALEQEPFDLVLLDCQMPELDGFETAQAIRSHEREGTHLPIVAMTARALEGDREACLEAGMDDYLTKPLRKQELVESLARLLHDKPPKCASERTIRN